MKRPGELLANRRWKGTGVLTPEVFDPVPFVDVLADDGAPWAIEERAG